MLKSAAATASKTLRDVIEIVSADRSATGDISVAGFLIAYGFPGREVSVGSIGSIPSVEALALNAMLSPQATLVVLTGDTAAQQRDHLAQIAREIEASGFELRLQFADLTLPNRWPHILSAMAHSEIGVLGVDARWASKATDFWATLQEFMKARQVLVYIRNMLDFRQPHLAIPLIRSMPEDVKLSVVVTTPSSVWFAADAVQASAARDLLRGSGLFPQTAAVAQDGSGEAPIVVTDESALLQIDADGRMPRLVVDTVADGAGGVAYTVGWSDAEADGCWTAGTAATVRVTLPPRSGVPLRLAITGNPWIPPNVAEQVISIGIGNKPADWTELSFTDPEEILTATVVIKDTGRDVSALTVQIKVQTPGRPSDFGGSDTRLLGFKMRSIAIFT